jgi:nucleotide-binding universal stress UspA family protein
VFQLLKCRLAIFTHADLLAHADLAKADERGWIMFKNILVPVDGGELSDAAVKRACSFAREVGARLTFYYAKPVYVAVYGYGEGVASDVGTTNTSFLTAREKRAEALLRNGAQAASKAGVGFETLSSECGSPYEGIIAAAESKACDLIFMASHGRRGASALLLGSETQKVLTHSKIPVLVYR